MASNVVVVDAAFKQTRVKVTPGRHMREVLEEVCKAKKLDPDSYTLKTQTNKVVDLSQPFRLSGLSAGAKLQLTKTSRSAGVVTIALQLPESESGGRLEDKFPSTTSLWLVLRKFEDAVAGKSSQKLNLTQRAAPPQQSSGGGRLEYEQPVLHLANRSLEAFTDLQKTLGQLGINSGSVLIRLSFKRSGTPLEQAMSEIGQYFSSLDSVPADIGSSASQGATAEAEQPPSVPGASLSDVPVVTSEDAAIVAGDKPGRDPIESSAGDEEMGEVDIDQPIQSDTIASTTPAQKVASEAPSNTVDGISVFRPPQSSTPAAALAPDDPSTFDPTIEDAKRHQAALQKAGRNTRLLSDKELEEQEQARQAKLATVQEVTIRVRYPDQSSIVLTMKASDTAADLHGKVMGTLEAAPEPFELRYVGDKGLQVLLPESSSQRLVRDLGFRGRVTVTMNWSPDASLKARQGRCLKTEYWSKAQDLKVQLEAQQAAGVESHRAAMAKKDPPGPGASNKPLADIESKLKKFMGFGKK